MDPNTIPPTTPVTTPSSVPEQPVVVATQPIAVTPPPVVEQSSDDDTNAIEQGSYVENVGGSFIDLLTSMSASDDLAGQVAKEMRLDLGTFKTLLASLLGKVQQGTITQEDIAIIMTAPMLEEPQFPA